MEKEPAPLSLNFHLPLHLCKCQKRWLRPQEIFEEFCAPWKVCEELRALCCTQGSEGFGCWGQPAVTTARSQPRPCPLPFVPAPAKGPSGISQAVPACWGKANCDAWGCHKNSLIQCLSRKEIQAVEPLCSPGHSDNDNGSAGSCHCDGRPRCKQRCWGCCGYTGMGVH